MDHKEGRQDMHMKETPQNDSGNRSGEEPHIDVKMQAYYDRLKTGKIDQADLISDSCQILKKASLSLPNASFLIVILQRNIL